MVIARPTREQSHTVRGMNVDAGRCVSENADFVVGDGAVAGIVGIKIDKSVGINVSTTEATNNSPAKALVTTKVRLEVFSHRLGTGSWKFSAFPTLAHGAFVNQARRPFDVSSGTLDESLSQSLLFFAFMPSFPRLGSTVSTRALGARS